MSRREYFDDFDDDDFYYHERYYDPVKEAKIAVALEKNFDLVCLYEELKNTMCWRIGQRRIKLFLNSLIKKGDKVAGLYRLAMECENDNINAKKYRNTSSFSYKDDYYEKKRENIEQLIRDALEYNSGLSEDSADSERVVMGWENSSVSGASLIVYFELPGCEQISFHTDLNGHLKNAIGRYKSKWDEKVNSTLPKLEAAIKTRYSEELEKKFGKEIAEEKERQRQQEEHIRKIREENERKEREYLEFKQRAELLPDNWFSLTEEEQKSEYGKRMFIELPKNLKASYADRLYSMGLSKHISKVLGDCRIQEDDSMYNVLRSLAEYTYSFDMRELGVYGQNSEGQRIKKVIEAFLELNGGCCDETADYPMKRSKKSTSIWIKNFPERGVGIQLTTSDLGNAKDSISSMVQKSDGSFQMSTRFIVSRKDINKLIKSIVNKGESLL